MMPAMILSQFWSDILVPHISVAEKMIRPILVYVFLIVGLRIAGKRELAQLNPFDLVVLLTLSNTVQNAIIGDDNSVSGGLIGATTLLVVNYLVVRFVFKYAWVDRLIEAAPDVLIERGKINRLRLQRELISEAELASAARKEGFRALTEVERAVLEPGGTISFIGKEPTIDDERHKEVLAELAEIKRQVASFVPPTSA
jgi:uncharacterized membrane protein YcaP (DUF421 family)